MALDAVKETIRARGERITDYRYVDLRTQADEMMGPWLILKAKERIAERKSKVLQFLVDVEKYGI
jgi:hypothetical protein